MSFRRCEHCGAVHDCTSESRDSLEALRRDVRELATVVTRLAQRAGCDSALVGMAISVAEKGATGSPVTN